MTNKDDNEQKDIRLKILSHFQKREPEKATEVLTKEILKNNHIYTTKKDKIPEMLVYKDGIYKEEGESEIRIQIREIMKENYSDFLVNQILAKIRTDTFIEAEILFEEKNIWEIAIQNGILNLKEKKLYPFTPKKIFFSKMPIIYNENSKVDKIDKFLSDILASSEDKKVFYEIIGMGLLKKYLMEKAIMMVGNGRNGKSKSIELLKKLMGAENCSSVPLSAMSVDSPFLQSLWKKHLNLAGDINSADLKETSTFKQLTGRDTISANRKYKNTIQFVNYATLIFACNELPRVYDYSDGFWERWVLLEFPYHFVDKEIYEKEKDKKNIKIKDPNIIDKITTEEEMSGLLNEAIKGLHRLIENKKFSYTIGTAEIKNKWIRRSDSFMAFCMDKLEEDTQSKIGKKELRLRYKDYCQHHKVRGVSDISIKITLQEHFGASEGYAILEKGKYQENCWEGIGFKYNSTLQPNTEGQEQTANQILKANQNLSSTQNKEENPKDKQSTL